MADAGLVVRPPDRQDGSNRWLDVGDEAAGVLGDAEAPFAGDDLHDPRPGGAEQRRAVRSVGGALVETVCDVHDGHQVPLTVPRSALLRRVPYAAGEMGSTAGASNWETGATWRYHDGTKHPYGALFSRGYTWNPAVRPVPYKEYAAAPEVRLALQVNNTAAPALAAISDAVRADAAAGAAAGTAEGTPTVEQLARLLHFSSGITKVLHYGSDTMPFRACACTGALFHIELYVACADLPGDPALAAGLYHYAVGPDSPAAVVLRRLRGGDYRGALVAASGGEPAVARAPVVLVATDVVFRNAVKYRERAYRHTGWDTGTLLANTLAVAAAERLPARIVLGYADGAVGALLALDPRVELPVALIPLGSTADTPPEPASTPPLDPIALDVRTTRDYESLFPAIHDFHEASSLAAPQDAAQWRGALRRAEPPPAGALTPLRPGEDDALPPDSLPDVIRRRGSARRFSLDPITYRQLSTVLDRTLRGVPTDFLEHERAYPGDLPVGPTDVYVIANAVEGLAPGAYVLHRGERALELLRLGDFRAAAYHLALDQELGSDAAVNVYFLADLRPVLERYGNRGYRAAQLEAAVAAGRMYLAAYAQRFAATGLTFFDDAVTDFFAPHAAGKSVMFLIALGHNAKRSRR